MRSRTWTPRMPPRWNGASCVTPPARRPENYGFRLAVLSSPPTRPLPAKGGRRPSATRGWNAGRSLVEPAPWRVVTCSPSAADSPGADESPTAADPSATQSPGPTESPSAADSPATDPSGGIGPGAAGSSSASYAPGAAGGAGPRFLGVGLPGLFASGAGLAGLAGTINLTMPVTTWLGLSDSPGQASGYGPLDAIDSRDLATALGKHPLTRWCVTVTDGNGNGRPLAHGCARKGASPPSGASPPGAGPAPGIRPPPHTKPSPYPGPSPGASLPAQAAAWLAGIRLEWLETGGCTHQRESPSYRPPPSLQHLLRVRQPTCSYPGCRRPAAQCDQDHTIAYAKGGRTCECNLAALCRRHHQAKQVQGWQLEQPQPGVLIWRLPHGRSYRSEPDCYPEATASRGGSIPAEATAQERPCLQQA